MSLDIPALRALCDAATPGPWEPVRDLDEVGNATIRTEPGWYEEDGHRLHGVRFIATLAEGNLNDEDAELIAARTALPAALDEIERLQAAEGGIRDTAIAYVHAHQDDPDLQSGALYHDLKSAVDHWVAVTGRDAEGVDRG